MGMIETTWETVCKFQSEEPVIDKQNRQERKKKSRGKEEGFLDLYMWLLVGGMMGKCMPQQTTRLFL